MQQQDSTIQSYQDLSNRELLEAVSQGNSAAFATLIERHQSLVCGIAFSHLGDQSLSEDVAQDVFLSLWRKPDSVHMPDKLRGWLRKVARNRACDVARRRKFETPSDRVSAMLTDTNSPIEALSQKERSLLLQQAIGAVSKTYREVLVLYYREGDSIERVAELLGISADAVKQRLSRGRKKMQERLTPFLADNVRKTAPTATFVAMVVSSAVAEAGIAKVVAGTGRGLLRKSGALLIAGILVGLVSLVAVFLGEGAKDTETSLQAAKGQSPGQADHGNRPLLGSTSDTPAKADVADEVLRLEGLVLDDYDEPVPEIRVIAIGEQTHETISGADGSFVFEGLKETEVKLRALGNNASSRIQVVRLTPDSEPAVLVLKSGMTMTVWVRDEQGVGIVNATAGAFDRETSTDEEGQAIFLGVPPEHGQLTVSAEGFAPSSHWIEGRDGKGEFSREVTLYPGVSLSGIVVDSEGDPLAGAEVHAAGNRMVGQSTTTGQEGRFVFSSLPVGRYGVGASYARLQSSRRIVNLDKGSIDEIRLEMPAAEENLLDAKSVITGVVVDESDQPVAGAEVRLFGGGATSPSTTNSRGEFVLSKVSGPSQIRATWPGESSAYYYLRSHEEPVEAEPGDELRLQLTTPGSLRGKIVLDGGGSPSAAWVSISTFRAGASSFAPSIGALGGTFNLRQLPPGTYVLNVYGPEFESVLEEEIVISPGAESEVTITVSEGRSISGLAVNTQGVGQAGIPVLVLNGKRSKSVQLISVLGQSATLEGAESVMKFGGRVTSTDADGRFVLHGVSKEEGVVWASEAGVPGETTTIAAGSVDLQLQVLVRSGATLKGFVTQQGSPTEGTVELCDAQDDAPMFCVYEAFAASDGSYEISAIAAGTYYARFTGRDDTEPTRIAGEIRLSYGEKRSLKLRVD